jgi:RimJ/RimL family protein N-acetyltransferase
MFLKGKFCQLRSIEERDLPLLLTWRNKPHVLQNMEYQEPISMEQHRKWHQYILSNKYHYFIIETLQEIPVGTIYISGKTDDNGAESGLYIGNEDYIGTGITVEASHMIINYAFNTLKLAYLTAKVKSSNSLVITYNQALGFKIDSEINAQFLRMKLSAKDANIVH